jgi:hypothetical protein
MTRDDFWKLIEESGPRLGDCEGQCDVLRGLLERLPPKEIVSFEKHRVRVMHESYRADLWNVIYIVEQGCGNDGFDYFRYWLILQGQETFYRVLANPELLGDFDQKRCAFTNESLGGVAQEAYQRRTGKEKFPYDGPFGPGKLKGKLLDEAGMRQRYPELWKRFF